MSHYTVAVITKNGFISEVEELLAPFSENIEVESYISRTKEEITEEGRRHQEYWLEKINSEATSKESLIEILTKDEYSWARKCLAAKTPQDFFELEAMDNEDIDEDGNEWSTYNKDSRWDWYEIGGRWDCILRDYDGRMYNTLQIKDWDYNYIDPKKVAAYQRFWEVVVEGAELKSNEDEIDFQTFYNIDYYLKKYGNKSNYVKCCMTFSTYALLTPDGEWFEPGKMGWWGVSHADPIDQGLWERDFTSLIDTFDKDMYVTIVDCHI